MSMARSIAALVLIGLSLSLTARAEEPPAAAEEPWALPKWRIGAGIYSYSGAPSVAAHRRISERCDLGLQVATTLQAGTAERDAEERGYGADYSSDDGDSDGGGSSLTLSGELRRWRPLARHLAWFGGLRLVATYDHDRAEETYFSDSESHWTRSRREVDTDYLSLGAALTLGADLELMRRLSATFALTPLTLSYAWRHSEGTAVQTRSDRQDELVRSDEDWDRAFTLKTSLSAQVYLTLSL